MNKLVLPMILVLLVSVGFASAMTFPNTAKVRVLHASPDAPPVDVWVNGAQTLSAVDFKDVTDYVEVPKGTYEFNVVPAGMTEPVVIDATLDLKPFKDYTVIAIDTLSEIRPLVLTDNRFSVPPRKAPVRFVHASPDAPAVDIAVKNGPVVFSSVSFGEQSRYAMLDSGTYDLEVRVAGTDIVALDLPGVSVQSGIAYTAIAVGELQDESLTAMLVEDRQRLH